MSGLLPHTLDRPAGLVECDTVVDIGPGIRPMGWYQPTAHICIEPHDTYADRLEAAGYIVFRGTASERLPKINVRGTLVCLLDSLEHMTKEEGRAVLDRLISQSPRQIVVFTPNGFMPQTGDAWGLDGDFWQEHRSGWTVEDFPGWHTEIDARTGGLLAIWTRS